MKAIKTRPILKGYIINDSWYGEMKFSKLELLSLKRNIEKALNQEEVIIN